MTSIGIALIGAGTIADYHLGALRLVPEADVRVIASRTLRRARAVADTYGVPLATDDIGAAINRNDVNAVIIVTPDDTHEALAIAALEAKRAVLLQKPMAASSAACLRIIEAARSAGADLQVSWMHRYFPEVDAARQLIESGAIGRVTSVCVRNATPGPDWGDWFFRKDTVSSGVVLQLGVHGIDIVGHLFGRIHSVAAHARTLLRQRKLRDGSTIDVENWDTAFALYEIEDGPIVHHEMSMIEAAGTDRFRVEIYGTEGTIWLRTERGTLAYSSNGTDAWTTPQLDPASAGLRQHRLWVDGLLGRAPNQKTALAGLQSLLVTEAVVSSVAAGGLSVPVQAIGAAR